MRVKQIFTEKFAKETLLPLTRIATIKFVTVATIIVHFIREYNKCSRADFKEAAMELLITTFFSTMPLWIAPLIGPMMFNTEFSYLDHLFSTIKGGELYVYCAALIGPLVYIITRKYGEISRVNSRFTIVVAFPHGASFIIFSALICIFSGFSFSLLRNPALSLSIPSTNFNLTGIFWSSIILYLFSLFCFFSASAYRNAMAGFVRDSRTEEDQFAVAWENRADVK
ncbi:MAG: hypothetical protein U1E81_03740 [Xanthobacteraceae bacterium]